MRKGQTAVEFIMLLAFILLLMIPVALMGFHETSDSSIVIESSLTVKRLKEAADMVYFQGPGARQVVQIHIPKGTNFSNSYIGLPGNAPVGAVSKEINLNEPTEAGWTDVWETTQGELRGYWPDYAGTFWYIVEMKDDGYVWLVPWDTGFTMDPPSYSTVMTPGDDESFTITLTSFADVNQTIDLTPTGEIATWLSLSLDETFLESLGTNTTQVTITVPYGTTPGSYTGSVSGTNGNETQTTEITVIVTSDIIQNCTITLFPSIQDLDLQPGDKGSMVFQVCNTCNQGQWVDISLSQDINISLTPTDGLVDDIYIGMTTKAGILTDAEMAMFEFIKSMPTVTVDQLNKDAIKANQVNLNDYDLLIYAGFADQEVSQIIYNAWMAYSIPIFFYGQALSHADSIFNFATGTSTENFHTINITNNSHYITEDLPLGSVQIMNKKGNYPLPIGFVGDTYATVGEATAVGVIEEGTTLTNGETAPARVVVLPSDNFDEYNTEGWKLVDFGLRYASPQTNISANPIPSQNQTIFVPGQTCTEFLIYYSIPDDAQGGNYSGIVTVDSDVGDDSSDVIMVIAYEENPPVIENFTVNPSTIEQHDSVNFTVDIVDDTSLELPIQLQITTPTPTSTNYSMFHVFNSNTFKYTNFTDTSVNGTYYVTVFAEDAFGNQANYSTSFSVGTIDEDAPIITIYSPTNTTYSSDSVLANITTNENAIWVKYSLDGAANVSMSGSGTSWTSTLSSLTDVSHYLQFFASDASGHVGTNNVYFTVNTQGPIYPDFLWELTTDLPNPVDFLNGLNTTGNTFGSGTDDGWDWGINPYSSGTSCVYFNGVKFVNSGNPTTSSVNSAVNTDDRLSISIGDYHNGCSNHGTGSGAYGVQFTITSDAYTRIQNGDNATLSFDWNFNDNGLDKNDDAWVKARFNGNYLGTQVGGANDDTNPDILYQNNPSSGSGSESFDVTSYITGAGEYYLDFGLRINYWGNNEWGEVDFDNIELVIQ